MKTDRRLVAAMKAKGFFWNRSYQTWCIVNHKRDDTIWHFGSLQYEVASRPLEEVPLLLATLDGREYNMMVTKPFLQARLEAGV